MNVAVATHFYPPEPAAGAVRVRSLVDSLTAAGHTVTVVTNYPSFPNGRFSDERRPLVSVERAGSARIVRLFSLLLRGVPGARLVHWMSAAFSASLYLLFSRDRYDVVIISSPPITLAAAGIAGAMRHRARLVVDVRDVFPDIAVAMGQWKPDGLLTRLVEWVAQTLYRRADLIVAVTPTAVAQIAGRGIDASHLMLAPNGPERRSPSPGPRSHNGTFTAIYAGNLGVASDIDVLLDAGGLLGNDGVELDIVGDGAERGRLERRIADERIGNVHLKGTFPREEAMAMLASADVSIVPLKKGIEESVPTKLYDALSVGCPVVVVADGEAQRAGTSLGALCSPAGDADALARVLRHLSLLDKSALRELGDRGRARVEAANDRAEVMAGVVRRIASCS